MKNDNIDAIESGKFKLEIIKDKPIDNNGETNPIIYYNIKLRLVPPITYVSDSSGFENLNVEDLEKLRNIIDIVLQSLQTN
jgi:hypothetical protein